MSYVTENGILTLVSVTLAGEFMSTNKSDAVKNMGLLIYTNLPKSNIFHSQIQRIIQEYSCKLCPDDGMPEYTGEYNTAKFTIDPSCTGQFKNGKRKKAGKNDWIAIRKLKAVQDLYFAMCNLDKASKEK